MVAFIILGVLFVIILINVNSASKKKNRSSNYPKITDEDIRNATRRQQNVHSAEGYLKSPSGLQQKELDLSFLKSELDIMYGETVVVDIETTGLPLRRNASPYETEVWPYIVQISWAVFDVDGRLMKIEDYLVKQSKPIPSEATRIHGITTKKANSEGELPEVVLSLLLEDIKYVKRIVTHNIEFDLPIIEAEVIRNNLKYILDNKNKICTMKSSVNFCAIPRSNGKGYKYPKLTELVGCLFYNTPDVDIPDAHSARLDMLMTAKCYFKLLSLNQISTLESPNSDVNQSFNDDSESMSDYIQKINSQVEIRNKQIEENKIEGIDAGVDRENIFFNKNIVITGSFRNWGDVNRLINVLSRLGGKIANSVINKTDLIICGKGADISLIESFRDLKSKGTVLEIANEDELLSDLNGLVLIYFEKGDEYYTEYIKVENGNFNTITSSGNVNYLKYQEFSDCFFEIKELEKMEIQSAIENYYELAEDYPQFKNQIYERLEVIYRKLKDYENEMRICLLDIENLEKEEKSLNSIRIEKLNQRYEKAKKLLGR